MPIPIELSTQISEEALFGFYVRNGICEAAYGREKATRVLRHPHVVVGAFSGATLVGVARATFDGLAAAIMELSLALALQGANAHANGSLVETDPHGVGRRLGEALLHELRRQGCEFVTVYPVEGIEEDFYRTLGFSPNLGHAAYHLDERPYAAPPDR